MVGRLLSLLPLRQGNSSLLDLPLLKISTDGSAGVSEDACELVGVVQDLEMFEPSDGDASDEDRGKGCGRSKTSEEGSENERIGW